MTEDDVADQDTSRQRTIIVTGGSGGIGSAIARRAARAGHGVCVGYAQDRASALRLVAELTAAGHRALAVPCEVSDETSVAALFEKAEATLGPVTGLVNNAGITGPIGPFRDLDSKVLRRVLDVNVVGTILCAREALRRWEPRATQGAVINISSTAATFGAPHEYVHYAASKAAVEAFTVGLAKEVAATGIRVNAVSPGMVSTAIHAKAGEPDRLSRVVSRVPMGRVGEPEEIANAVVWLLSDEASYVTGEVLKVAGGM